MLYALHDFNAVRRSQTRPSTGGIEFFLHGGISQPNYSGPSSAAESSGPTYHGLRYVLRHQA